MSERHAPQVPQPPRERVRFWLVAIGLAAAWCVYLTFFGPKAPHGALDRPALEPPPGTGGAGVKASFDWRLEDLGGRQVDLSSYRGKPFVLNVWATWCPPCVAELPSINNLAEHPRMKGIPVVCISVDDDLEAVTRFSKSHTLSATMFHSTGPPPGVFQTRGIPATFIVDGEGNIVAREVGAARWDDPGVIDLLESLRR